MLIIELIGFNFGKEIASIVDILFGTNCFTSVCEADTSLQIDDGAKNEITVYDGFVEVAGVSEVFLKVQNIEEDEYVSRLLKL